LKKIKIYNRKKMKENKIEKREEYLMGGPYHVRFMRGVHLAPQRAVTGAPMAKPIC
jgi:hypothetical protein